MQTITVNFPDNLAALLDEMCAHSSTVKEVLIQRLVAEHLEEVEDYMDACRAIEEGGEAVGLEDMMKKYGVEG